MTADVLQATKGLRSCLIMYLISTSLQDEPLPHELRPTPVLMMTMNYLLQEIADQGEDGKWSEWYDFLWNRTRSIRKVCVSVAFEKSASLQHSKGLCLCSIQKVSVAFEMSLSLQNSKGLCLCLRLQIFKTYFFQVLRLFINFAQLCVC